MSARPEWIEAPGFYPEMLEADYFLDPCPEPSLRQSGIKVLNGRSPYHFAFEHPRLNPYAAARSTTRFMRMGSAVHSLALGRGREVSIVRYPNWQSSSAKRARDLALAANRIPVLEHEHERATAIAGVVRERIEEELDGAEYLTEVPLFWREAVDLADGRPHWIWCAAMLDVWSPARATALDVKASSVAAIPDDVGRDMAANGYDVQNVWYRRGLGALLPEGAGRFRFATLYVETDPPHGACAFELDESSRTLADAQCTRAARTFAHCLAARSWPSYPRAAVVGTPPWHQTAIVRALEET